MFKLSTVRGLALGTMSAFVAITGAMAGDAPAVSALNGKAAIVGTYNNQDNQDDEIRRPPPRFADGAHHT